jgi:hypothetical protein
MKYREIKGTIAKLRALARKLGFKYRPGDRVFRTPRGEVKAFRVIRSGRLKIFAQRVRATA